MADYSWNYKQLMFKWEDPTLTNFYRAAFHKQTAVIGCPLAASNSGSAYIYTYEDPGCNLWLENQVIKADDSVANDYFGNAVSLNDTYILVGALENEPSGANSGAAYIFTASAGIWDVHQKIGAYDGAVDDYFGHAVAIHPTEEILAVTSWKGHTSGWDAGIVYIFTGSGGKFFCSQRLARPTGSVGTTNEFGYNIKLSGSWLFATHVGYPTYNSAQPRGALWIYHNNGSNIYGHNQSILATDFYSSPIQPALGKSFSVNQEYLVMPTSAESATNSLHAATVYKNISGIWTFHSNIDHSQHLNWGSYDYVQSYIYKPADYTNDNDLFAICGYPHSDPSVANSGTVILYRYNINLGRWIEKLILTGSANGDEWGGPGDNGLAYVYISGSNKENFDIIFPVGGLGAGRDLQRVYGLTASFVEPITCNTPLIDSNFTLNHYICLPTNYNTTESERCLTIPFSYLHRPHFFVTGSKMRAK